MRRSRRTCRDNGESDRKSSQSHAPRTKTKASNEPHIGLFASQTPNPTCREQGSRLAIVSRVHELTGDDLTLSGVWDVAVDRAPAGLSARAVDQMQAAREVVQRVAHGTSEHTYGVNTGFGRFVSKQIPEEQTEELQLRLLRSHACGVGVPYPDDVVRAAMLLRANALAKGNSGARPRPSSCCSSA